MSSDISNTTKQAWNIELKQLTIGFGEHIVLNDINATIPAGKITMILGGSGCGKSTLLRHIIGLKRPLSGSIFLGNQDFFSLPNKDFKRLRRHMGVLFQDGALLGSLSVAENIALPLTEHIKIEKPLINELVAQRLKLVGLEDFGNHYPSELSGGMKKRAGLARAIVVNPQILLCDEPTSGLDPINSAKMDRLLLSLKAQFPFMTIVVVSHDLASMEAIADHVLLLADKTLVFEGSKDNLKNSTNEYIVQFLNRKFDLEKIKQSEGQPLNINPEIKKRIDQWLEQ
ncbi:ABC transporter ATP-binding protein [Desulfovibrio litoralis]|uniref:Phospholipid/cholesterol/gamma-HCH transport system ATP-binding protein n=1 Tax=Desulfovibrio litoralis DSM 11393 TaxID=1121455 RepID=A0A1M7S6P5_9BACT|nr:ABC transporter ATP-binding protein [Desulfovibrio litoralis]SHN54083.1 phospholipid/cholesterol/gamma-HCH transport system ATP-binding protein [Desulfovibrio litoralis DSM 11393]